MLQHLEALTEGFARRKSIPPGLRGPQELTATLPAQMLIYCSDFVEVSRTPHGAGVRASPVPRTKSFMRSRVYIGFVLMVFV